MTIVSGFNQEQLNELWADDAAMSVKRLVDNEVEQVMVFDTPDGQLNVRRAPGGVWQETPYVGNSTSDT